MSNFQNNSLLNRGNIAQASYQQNRTTNYSQTYQSSNTTTGGKVEGSYAVSGYQIQGRREEREADQKSYLKWRTNLSSDSLTSGSNDYTHLSSLKDAILELRSQFFNPKGNVSVTGTTSDELSRRFLLIEHEIDGLLRRRIDYSTTDHINGVRNLDFTTLINEKENQIVELENKILNLEARLRKSSARQIQLENKIVALKAENLQAKGLSGQKLDDAVKREAEYERVNQQLKNLRETFGATVGIWTNKLNTYKLKYPNQNWELEASISQKLRDQKISVVSINNYAFLQVHTDKTVEVPVQDTRTKHLIHLLSTNLKRLLEKYPKIKEDLSLEIVEFFSQEIIDVIQVDSFDRLIEIIKYVPQSVRVENVYSYSSSKSRRVEFHLRVLIKALLEQIEKLKTRYGAVLEIDEGVIGMINQEIMDVISVDDILKVFRVVPKIVEVERIVEKIVERIVEVPKVIPVEKYVEKIVEVPRYIEVEKIVHKPVEVIKIVDNCIEKFIPVPTIEEKVVEVPTEKQILVPVQKQVAKLVEVEKIVQEIVVQTKFKEVEKIVNHVIREQVPVECVREVPVAVETVREVIKQVQVFVDRIIPVEVVRVEVVEVQRIVEKIVKETCYVPANSTQIVIKEVIKEIPVYIEKIVPVETIVTKIVNVPQRIQVPVLVKEVTTEVKTVEVFVDKIVEKVVIKQIEKIVNHVVQKQVEVIKIVQRIVEIPILQDKIVTVPIYITQVVIERIHVPHIVPIKCIEEKIIEKPTIVEIEKPYIQYIKDIQVVNCTVQKIVQVEKIVERIKEVKVRVEKIVNKLVQVPKVVEIEKVVEKIVVVPRVIQKIVEVPQIIEVTVEKIVEVVKVQIVERIVEKIVYVDKPVEVEKIRNVYLQIDRPVEKLKEIPVIAETIIEKKEVIQVPVDKLVTAIKEVPVEIIVDKIVPNVVESLKVIEIQRPTTVVVEVPKIVDRKIEVPVEVIHTFTNEVHMIEKVQVPVAVEVYRNQIIEVQKIVKQNIIVIEPKVFTETKVVINEKFTPVTQETKIPVQIPAGKPFVEPIVVDRIIEKAVEVRIEEPRVITVQILREIPVERVQVVELEKIVNHIETEIKVVRELVDRIVPVPSFEQYPVQQDIVSEKIVQVRSVETVIKPETQIVQKIVQKQNFTTVTDKIPCYEQNIQVVDRFESTQVPVFTTRQKIVLVPEFQEKIFQRIVIMPQVVEIIKFVTQICETDSLGVGLSVDIVQQERIYKELQLVTRKQIQILLVELRKLRSAQPNLIGVIQLLERYIIDFDKLTAVQRIIPVDRERVVEREVPRAVLVPTKDSESVRNELAYAILIEKLILELKRVKKENSNVKFQLDNDINLFFFTELHNQPGFNAGGNFQDGLANYTKEALAKLNALGGSWASDHELMLSTILQQRFAMGNLVKQANIQIEKAKAISTVNSRVVKDLQNKWLPLQKLIKEKQDILNKVISNNPKLNEYSELISFARDFEKIANGSNITFEPLRELQGTWTVGTGTNWSRAVSRIRELQLSSTSLLSRLEEAERSLQTATGPDTTSQYNINILRTENERLVREIDNLKKNASLSSSDPKSQSLLASLKSENERLLKEIESIKRSSSLNSGSTSQITQEYEARLRQSAARVQQLEIQYKTANSRIADLESQLRNATLKVQEIEAQLKSVKETRSSAATDYQLIDSKYSSSSSNANVTKTGYETANYGANSVHSVDSSSSGLTSSGIRGSSAVNYIQPTGSTYATGGTSAYQSTANKVPNTSSESSYSFYGATTPAGNAGLSYGSTGPSASTYGTSGTTSAYGSTGTPATSTYGTYGTSNTSATSTYGAPASSTYGTGPSSTSTYGASNTSASNYGTTGGNVSSTSYGATTKQSTTGLTGATNLTASGNYSSGLTSTPSVGLAYNSGASYGAATGYGVNASVGLTGSGAGGVASSLSSNASSSLSNSGLRQGGANYSQSSNYTFQTKKF